MKQLILATSGFPFGGPGFRPPPPEEENVQDDPKVCFKQALPNTPPIVILKEQGKQTDSVRVKNQKLFRSYQEIHVFPCRLLVLIY